MAVSEITSINCNSTIPDYSASVNALYNELMSIAVGTGSIYDAVINLIEDIIVDGTNEVSNSQLSISERAKIISEIASEIVVPISTTALEVATEAVKFSNQFAYDAAKIKAEIQLKLAQGTSLLKSSDVIDLEKKKVTYDALETQAILKRDYGATDIWSSNISDTTKLTLEQNNCTKRVEIANHTANTTSLLGRSIREYGTASDIELKTDSSNSKYWYTVTPTISLNTNNETDWVSSGLIANQTASHYRQYYGFEDNKLQHVINSASNTIGLIAAEGSTALQSQAFKDVYTSWRNTINSMKTPMTRA